MGWWRRPGDVAAVAMLVALPALVFGVPALLGHAVMPGDDLTQNFPLRVLAGREIRAGRPPLLDAYDWSGSPLLAGWNAGAAYPLTWLFAVLPAVAAWTAGMIVTWAAAGTGMFCFLRALRLRALPSFLGALSFALAGAMSAQAPHFGLVAGMSWVPWALLGIFFLTNDRDSPSSAVSPLTSPGLRLRWAPLLAVAVGLIILAGEPRAIVDGFTIIGLYAVWQVGRLWLSGLSGVSGPGGLLGTVAIFARRWRRVLPTAALIAGGCLLGVGLGAVQWLPGLASISSSQRGTGSMALFSSGSLPPEWLFLALIPDILGGAGTLSQPSFFANYSLTEVTSYVGILPLVAACALLVRAFFSRRGSEYLIWHVVGVVGVALALGGDSPLGQVLYRLPLYGSQRLQSRNILLLDLALAILLAYWLNDPFPRALRKRRASTATAVEPDAGRPLVGAVAETLAGVLPPLGILALAALSLTWGAGLLRWIGTGPARAAEGIGPLRPWLLPSVVLAVAAIALVVFGRRLGQRWWARACAGFVAVDIVVFTVLAVIQVTPAPVSSPSAASAPASPSPSPSALAVRSAVTGTATGPTAAPSAARPVSTLGYPGRYAIYDPGLLEPADLSALGPPDVNVLADDATPSVQGYSSIVDGSYAAATGSHGADGEGQDVLSPAAIGNGTLDSLNTSVLLTLPSYLTTTASSAGTAASGAGPSTAGRRSIQAGQSATWFLGEAVAVSRVSVPDGDARADAARGAEMGLMTPSGTISWYRARAATATALEISVPSPVTATAVLARASGGSGASLETSSAALSASAEASRPTGASGPADAVSGASRSAGARVLGAPSITLAGGRALVANGQLQDDLTSPRWSMVGFDGAFAVFTDRFASGPLTVQPLPTSGGSGSGSASGTRSGSGSGSAAGIASVRYATSAPGNVTTATVSSAHGVRLVRSMAAIPGWTATWRPRQGPAVPLSVLRDGIVQAVDVPPGQGIVTWHYTTPRFGTGLAVSVVAALCTAGLAVWRRHPRAAARIEQRPEREREAV